MSWDARDLVGMEVARAETPADVSACRRLVGQVYGERYGVTFTEGGADPWAKREPWPTRFAFGRIGGEIVTVSGLYEEGTYAEAFGGVSRDHLERVAAAAGVDFEGRRVVEYTKLVVAPGWENLGLGAMFLALTHSRGFLCPNGGPTPFVLACGKLSVFRSVYRRARVATRTLCPFPQYPSHERYRSADDPMESRVVVPERDLDPLTHSLQLPIALDLALHGDRRVA